MPRTSRCAAGLVAVLATALLVACGAPASGDAGGGATGQNAAAAAALAPYLKKPSVLPNLKPLPQRPPTGKTVYYVNTGSGSAAEIAHGVEAAAKALGWSYKQLTYNVANPATGNSAYLAAMNAGADGIISTGLPQAAIRDALDKAKAKGVKVVLINPTESPEGTDIGHVGNVQVLATAYGKVNALAIAADSEKSGKKAKVAVVSSSGIPILTTLTDAMIDGLKENCQGCEVDNVDVSAAAITSGQASTEVISYIQRHPGTNYVNLAVGAFEGGMRSALDAAGLKDVKIAGTQPTVAQNKEIQSGDSLFWLQVPYGYEAWEAVDALARSFTGGELTTHNTEEIPIWVVDKTNLDFDPKKLPEFPTDYQSQFAKLWKVSPTS
ncbi:ABC-type sugar transport system substrate-binding protein [Kribbella sp. VKM Ac-2527]|uniref:ABC-type sugar transport system substrate-binding protein n=1 Tax=Kribbella caucasensis TaxID=2512215 RepID=A0A4R6KIK7_9ACTN|nr:substrate-binding domain-containing protein [Kribbella sp. VKM Ac-2527]TDO50547.1 ABC-type sugar transport system substrate-binding protein [Kribbella sp. VKM Ac-2527]